MMKYQTFSEQEHDTYKIGILVGQLERDKIAREYLDPTCISNDDAIAYELYQTGKKTKVADQKEYLDAVMPIFEDLETSYIIVGDGDYFKTLTGAKKADAYLGYVLPNSYPEQLAGQFNVVYCPNYRQVFYNPAPTKAKILRSLEGMQDHMSDRYEDPGYSIIKEAHYPSSVTDIAIWLEKLLEMDAPLTCDIEGYSLKHYDAGIGTISFAWSMHEGIAFAVDQGNDKQTAQMIRNLLINFFKRFSQTMTYHHISYDVTVLIYQLFMKDITDTEGLLTGLEVMLKNWDDTKLISYLATNTCAGNKLGLKEQAQEFAGNYAVEEIKDITLIPLPELLQYNLVDCLSTWHVRGKHWDTMVADKQLELYEDLFKPAIVDITQLQLTGMPLDMGKVAYARQVLKIDRDDAIARIQDHKLIKDFMYQADLDWVEFRNATLKTKRIAMGDEPQVFNPNSNPQKQKLFFELLALPVLEQTKSKQPATKSDVLEKLKAYTDDQEIKDLINAFLDFAAVDKIYGTFIPAMEQARLGADGCYYLFGSFNLGGTVSGRLSSSEPNLQTIPSSGTKYAKIIKDCFRAPKGWLMIGLDFSSLEDRISALTTKDPNKLKVYTDGFDGHCLRAFSYFGEQMPDIVDTVESINSIADKYESLRQTSKTPTFLLTYGGTHIGMVAKCDFTKEVAKQIEQRYHKLYVASDQWVAARIKEATKVGYITAAFGLRVRTPLLAQVILGNRATPYEAEAEGRTAGNALGQSWCLLNTRASMEFMRIVRASKYRLLIRPIAHIHDAQYYLIPDDLEVLLFVNKHLVKAVEWQDDPAIEHPTVKLGGKLSVFYPSWATEIGIPNGANEDTVRNAVQKKLAA